MQPTAETESDSEDQYKHYAYNETDYEDSDSDLEEGEIREQAPDEQDLSTLQEAEQEQDEHNMQIQFEYCTEERAWVQYFPYPDQPPQDPATHPWLDLTYEEFLVSAAPYYDIPQEV